jgi:hypothetical protein
MLRNAGFQWGALSVNVKIFTLAGRKKIGAELFKFLARIDITILSVWKMNSQTQLQRAAINLYRKHSSTNSNRSLSYPQHHF